MSYAAEHRKILAKLKGKRAVEVTLSFGSPGTYNPLTDEFEGGDEHSVSGLAVEIPGDPEEYAGMDLIAQSPITMFFAPFVLGQAPVLHSTVSWAGATRTVQRIFPIRPDGEFLAGRIILV